MAGNQEKFTSPAKESSAHAEVYGFTGLVEDSAFIVARNPSFGWMRKASMV